MPSDHSNYTYDVFVSYSHIDRDWVWGELVPRLKEAGFAVCTDRESFDVGVPALINMENAVSLSRHSILVLTPSWLESEWSNFEALLVQAEDPMGIRQRTLPVMLRSCDPPRRISMLTWADLTGQVDKEAEFMKLTEAVRGARRLSSLGKDIAHYPLEHELAAEKQVFNLRESGWIGFVRQIDVYRRDPTRKVLLLFSEIERKLARIVNSPTKPFYETTEWKTLVSSLEYMCNYEPNPNEQAIKSSIIENLSKLLEDAGQQVSFFEDWQGSQALFELTLKLAPRNPRAMSRLEQATHKLEELESLKESRYEMLQRAILTEDEESIRTILVWFAEKAPNYHDIPGLLNEHGWRLK